jgi:hypothetical protein
LKGRITMNRVSSATVTGQSEIPGVQEFCVSIPLYKEYDISKCARQRIQLEYEFFQGAIDAYCRDCARESVFQSHLSDLDGLKRAAGSGQVFLMGRSTPDTAHVEQESGEAAHSDRDFALEFRCTRNQGHWLRFYFSIKGNKIQKVGQYPSLADLHQSEISKYRTILKDKYAELARAVGLHAHDVGIGAYVYLRRVFEHLIDKAHEAASQEAGWDEQAFQDGRMPEKIKLLGNHLPSFMVENANMYGILSKGIHELTEDECLTYFAVVKTGIKLILDEEIARKEREANIKETKKEIARITGEIRGQ